MLKGIVIIYFLWLLTVILTFTGIISFHIFLCITGITVPILTYIIYYKDKQKINLSPKSLTTPKMQITPEDLTKLLNQYGVNEGIFEIPKDHLPLHESFINLAKNYSKISFSTYGSNEFNRALMIKPFHINPLFLQIGEWDSIGLILIRRNSDDANVYIADYHEDMNNPTVHTSSLHDYFVLSWETLHEK